MGFVFHVITRYHMCFVFDVRRPSVRMGFEQVIKAHTVLVYLNMKYKVRMGFEREIHGHSPSVPLYFMKYKAHLDLGFEHVQIPGIDVLLNLFNAYLYTWHSNMFKYPSVPGWSLNMFKAYLYRCALNMKYKAHMDHGL